MSLQTFDKTSIALIQLRKAIQLFNNREFICSLTLAGASDEILGELAKNNKGYNAFEGDKAFFDSIAQITKRDRPSLGKAKQTMNKIKNSLKHHNSSDNNPLSADFEFEAQNFIDGAIRNYWIAYNEPPKDRVIKRYVDWAWN